MRVFLIATFSLLTIGFIFLFFFVQNQKPKNIIDENNKQASQLYAPGNNTDNLATPPPDNEGALNAPPPTAEVMQEATVNATAETAVIKTSKGDITISFFKDVAPKTVANFVNKAASGYYNNLTFHRVEDWVLQGGDPKGDGTGGGDMPTEFNDKPFVVGAVGVARRNDPKVQNDSQFFIVKSDATWLNGQYTNFGMVIDGMDVVNNMEIGDKILDITLE